MPAAAGCGHAPIGYDYNGDGSADQVVGVPGDSSGKGSVEVRLGPASGHPSVQPLPAPDAAAGDRFGTATVSVDFNQDTCDDLLAGAPGRDVAGVADAGAIYVYAGSPQGLTYVRTLTMGAGGLPGTAQAGAGMPLDVQVGAPGEDLGTGLEDAGFVVGFLVLEEGSPPFRIHRAWRVSAATIGGTNTPGARFGSTIGSIRPNELSGPGPRYQIYGAPGTSNDTGKVFFHDTYENQVQQWTKATGSPAAGDLYGSNL